MPAASPWIDTWAPAQYSQLPAEPDATSGWGRIVNQTGLDTTLHWKISGTIVLALIVIFGLQMMGFRFVTSASLGVGR